MVSPETRSMTRAQRTALLAVADGSALEGLADRCLADGPNPKVVGPQLGMVPMSVREPVAKERFLLTDVLVTQAEVSHRGTRGWAMRLGDEPAATLAAALLDAEVEAGGSLADEVEHLLRETARHRVEEDTAEWAELAATRVRFEELI